MGIGGSATPRREWRDVPALPSMGRVATTVAEPGLFRNTAAHYGVPFPAVEIHGHDALYKRVTRAYEMFVASVEYVFEQSGEVTRHAGSAVALPWVMRSRTDGSVAGRGLEVLTFAPDRRVRTDHEYVG
ncbi:hypothetical protein [Saccharomonospora xinjiangensis]|uniref:SnoaL-like domain-containing protein n=1 Tax=Saccharomonospora xinjiangensis XJ-54 TaxID=882086 RepID=I0V340_9PSEU|nr:hypothetical protein [Saccharomonospora xinjiangensis]EID54543.1 hypothetical protein SacxiDRAFT_2314 [Saccharomonospora xinjiangensis XJ-54]